jgi:hypothetical protein
MRGLLVLAVALSGFVEGCSRSICDEGDDVSTSAEGALFTLTCASGDLTQIVVTGPCTSGPTSGSYLPVYTTNGSSVTVYSPTPGVCHVELIFAAGFTYSADVTYVWQEEACGSRYAAPTSTSAEFAVDNPGDTCLDGGE